VIKDPKEAPLTAEQLEIRRLAYQLTDMIEAKDGKTRDGKGNLEPSHQDFEYVAVVYRDGDTLKIGRLHTSNQTSEAPLGRALDEVGAENVVAVVHNHPMAHVDKEYERNNKIRSKDLILDANMMPSTGDWEKAKSAFGDRMDVTYFLLDPKGDVRAYEYADREKWYSMVHESKRELFTNTYDPKPAPIIPRPAATQEPTTASQTSDASSQSQRLYAQATDHQLPSMQQFSDADRHRMCAHAVYLGAQRGWSEIEGVAPNNATAHHRAGEFLCVAGKSNSPDPTVNGAAVPMENALKASPGEWLGKADTARQEYAIAQTQAQTQTQQQMQTQTQGPTIKMT
jgi:hypothetical protein